LFNAFGSKKQPEKKPEVKEVNLQDTNDRLGNSINDTKLKLDAINKELKVALEQYKNSKGTMKNSAKTRCVNLMKKKKMYESHINTLESTQFNVENVHLQTQMMKDNINIVSTLKQTTEYQKEVMKGMNVDNVYDIMDDMRDAMDDQKEISEALTRNYEIDVNDEELDQELDEIDAQMRMEFDAKDLCVPGAVGKQKVVSQKEKDEKVKEEDNNQKKISGRGRWTESKKRNIGIKEQKAPGQQLPAFSNPRTQYPPLGIQFPHLPYPGSFKFE